MVGWFDSANHYHYLGPAAQAGIPAEDPFAQFDLRPVHRG